MLGGAIGHGSAEEAALLRALAAKGRTSIGQSVVSRPFNATPVAGHPGSGAANAWPAINHQLVIALARSSVPSEGWDEWRRNSLASQARHFPEYWAGVWSGADYTATVLEPEGRPGLAGAASCCIQSSCIQSSCIQSCCIQLHTVQLHKVPIGSAAPSA